MSLLIAKSCGIVEGGKCLWDVFKNWWGQRENCLDKEVLWVWEISALVELRDLQDNQLERRSSMC